MDYLEIARERFKRDEFATEALGAVIDALDENGAVCSVALGRRHVNGVGEIMGGAIFTLADFAFAVATNYIEDTTVTQTSQITYLGRPKGKRLIAESKKVKSGRSTCFYTVDVKDELGSAVAMVTMTGYRISR
jgi:acyl-CoA thioesterase